MTCPIRISIRLEHGRHRSVARRAGPGPDAAPEGQGAIAARSPLELFWRRLRTDKVAVAAGVFIVLLVLAAVFAPLIVKLVGATGPNEQNPKALDSFGTPTGPTAAHIFGVDTLGRDVFARVLYGARVSLQVAIIATAISVFIGVSRA